MATPTQLLVVGTLALVGVAFVAYGGRQLRPAVRILRNDPVAVRDLEHLNGTVEVAGTAIVDESTALAPFSGRECLACRYTVEEYRQSGKHGHWETLEEGTGGVPFLVDDGTGRVPVDPTGADLRLSAHATRVDPGEEPPEQIARYVAESEAVGPNDRTIDLELLELNVGKEQRFTEHRLDAGEDVHVYGPLGRPEEAPEWGSDRVDADIRHQSGHPFIISDTSERATAWRVARRPLGLLALGAVLVVVALAFTPGLL